MRQLTHSDLINLAACAQARFSAAAESGKGSVMAREGRTVATYTARLAGLWAYWNWA
jgi:hypothetical protein